MIAIDRILLGLSALAGVGVIGLSVTALVGEPIAPLTVAALGFFLALLTLSLVATWRWPDRPLVLVAALFNILVVGRLFSTMHLAPPDAAGGSTDPLFIAETGPGVASITYASTVLFVLLVVRLLSLAVRDSRSSGGATAEQWGLTALRIYVGLMFIAHFAGHLFAGPAPFKVFVDYFGSIGLPQPAAFVILAGLIELAVTIGLAFGFMTRLAAIGAAVYLFVSVGLGGHYSVGYIWVLPTGGWEFPALWIFATAIFAFTGGGPISLDARLRQLPSALRPLFQ